MAERANAIREWETTAHLSDTELEATWRQYRRRDEVGARNRLMEHYLPTVRYCCEWIHGRLPAEVELDDVMSAGIDGLRHALAAFDPKREVRFETYLVARIRGAVLDYLRSIDWVPRLVRARAGKLAKASDALSSELGRPPTATELARSMGLSINQLARVLRDAEAVRCFSLDRYGQTDKAGRAVYEDDGARDPQTPDPASRAHLRDLRVLISRGLTATERQVIILYYHEQMTMREIGATLNLSESRISQMHSAILQRLRAKLKGRQYEFGPMEP